jgi:hypothetical protein
MNIALGLAKCGPCDALMIRELDDTDPEHVACPGCGARLPLLTRPATVMDGMSWVPDMSKGKGWRTRGRLAFNQQRDRGGALVRHERYLTRGARYVEKVTLCETGKIIHHCDERLSEHRSHGSDKRRS